LIVVLDDGIATDGLGIAALNSIEAKTQFAGFRENILYREADPFFDFASNESSPVAVATGPVNTAVLTLSFQLNQLKAYVIENITLGLDKAALVQLQFPSATRTDNPFPNSGDTQGFNRLFLPAGQSLVIPCNYIARAYKVPTTTDNRIRISVISNLTGGSVSYIGSLGFTGWRLTDDLDYGAPKVIMVVGDSIVNGQYGATQTKDWWPMLFKSAIGLTGQRARVVLKSTHGSNTTQHETWRANGYHNIAQCDLCFYALGANDAVGGASGATYTANLTAFWNWYRFRYPNGKMIVLGPAPIENDTSEANAVAIRAAAASYVSSVASSRLAYVDLGSAFDRTLESAVYYSFDTPGSRIHPNTAGHAAIGAIIKNRWDALGWTL
jgi:lysophospholipase L1-like esterase